MYRELGQTGVAFGLRGGPYTGRPQTFSQAELPPYLLERLRAVIEGRGGPEPILKRKRAWTTLPLVGSVLLAGVAAWLVVWLARRDFGDALHLYQGPEKAVFYAIATATMALAGWWAWQGLKALPGRGVYLLPLDVVEVGRDTVTVSPMGNVRQVTIEVDHDQPSLLLTFDHGACHAFPVASEEEAERALALMERAQDTLEALSNAIDLERALDLDPFFALRGTGSRGQEARLREPSTRSPLRRLARWAAVAALGMASGVALWKIRNMASDQALFNRAAAANTTQSYERYLAAGQLCRDKATAGLHQAREYEEARAREQRRCEMEAPPGTDCHYDIMVRSVGGRVLPGRYE